MPQELIKGMYVKRGKVDFVLFEIDFNAELLAKMLVDEKDWFAKNKGYGKIRVMMSKAGKPYCALDKFVPEKKESVSVSDHLENRSEDDGLPF